MKNHSQSLTLKFVNSIWEKYKKTEGVLTYNHVKANMNKDLIFTRPKTLDIFETD